MERGVSFLWEHHRCVANEKKNDSASLRLRGFVSARAAERQAIATAVRNALDYEIKYNCSQEEQAYLKSTSETLFREKGGVRNTEVNVHS
ncbi:hypothetical protein OESDEN_13260 [Oesophagostomum dentatum]|uniref:Uncharacterized protein n=1 Tax=Oesophagostomum dentatum TaxID=61180 RepID=A0A0B1SUT2_OESDE|nr:hypothetical protein OESDEN_13260 [Oesophagostomum dentatum]